MQIGGSDQFGNITAGIDAIKYISAHHPDPVVREACVDTPFGFTVPLLTTSSGVKFGKSAGNAIWLDNEQTSSFELYGFFLRTPDADVGRYLKLFTFIPIEEIDVLVVEHMEEPHKRKAQHRLAREFVELVHGPEEAKNTEAEHRLLFSSATTLPEQAAGEAAATSSAMVADAATEPAQITLNNAPKANIKLPYTLIHTKSIGRILYAAGLASSASEGHRLAAMQSVYIGGPPGGHRSPMSEGGLSFQSVKLWRPDETKNFLIGGKLLILRRGKHNVRLIEVVSDEEFAKSGATYPGMETHDGSGPVNGEATTAEEVKGAREWPSAASGEK